MEDNTVAIVINIGINAFFYIVNFFLKVFRRTKDVI